MALLPNSLDYTGALGGPRKSDLHADSVNELLSNLLDAMGPSTSERHNSGSSATTQSVIGSRVVCLDERSPSESPQTSSSAGSLSCYKCDDRFAAFLDCRDGFCLGEYHCDVHCEAMRYYCETCRRLVCQECTLWDHKEHVCSPARDAADAKRAKLRESLESGRTGTKLIRQSIDRAVAVSRTVERDAAQISIKIRKAMRHFAAAIEERERQLLEKVGEMRQAKLNELSEQMRGLRDALAGLVQTNERIAEALELDGVELLAVEDAAEARIEAFAGAYKSLQPKEEGFLFVSPNFELIVEIKKQGDVASSTCAKTIAATAASVVAPIGPSGFCLKRNGQPTAFGQPKTALVRPPNGRKVAGQCVPGSALPVFAKSFRSNPSNAPIVSFGIDGHEDGQLSRPWGLCVDRDGNIIVADRRNNRIQIFSPEGAFILKFGTKGTGPGEFDLPAGITTDPQGRIVVVDKDNHRVQIFTSTGGFILAFGTHGKGCGQFKYPWDVAVNSERQIVVTDSRNYRIQLFNSEGAFVTMLTFDGSNHSRMLKGLTTPRGVCFTPLGDVIVSDFENHRLLLVDSTLTSILGAKGYEGMAVGEFSRPSGVICDDEGKIIVADSKNQRVIAFSPFLDFLWALEVKGTGPEDNDRPTDIGLTKRGDLVVVVEGLPDSREGSTVGKTFVQIF